MADPIVLAVNQWTPDQPSLLMSQQSQVSQSPLYASAGAGTQIATNVLARTPLSYGPALGLSVYSNALTARCQGVFTGLDTGGNVHVFAGDANDLYHLTSSSTSWTNVSKSAGGYTIASDAAWRFTLMNGRIIATDYADAVQTFALDTDTKFSDLSSGAPKARYCAVIKNFLVLGNTTDATNGNQPQCVWWSALNDPTNFPTPGTSSAAQVQSDFNNLYGEGGWVQGVVGNLGTADGAVFMEHAVWRMIYAGPPAVFSFQPAEGVRGTPAPQSIVQLGAFAYYYGEDGFYSFDGSTSQPIGANKIDKWFAANVDSSNLHRIVGAVDTTNKQICWAVPLGGNVGGNPNAILVYNWQLDRWTRLNVTCETIGRTLSFGYTLDGLDTVSASIDALSSSLDSRVWTGGKLLLGAFDTSHQLNYFNGSVLAATVDTIEAQPFPGKRGLIRNARPLVDGGSPSVAIKTRNRLLDTQTLGSAVAANSNGDCPQYVSGRYMAAEITMGAGDTGWTNIEGVEIDGEVQGVQ